MTARRQFLAAGAGVSTPSNGRAAKTGFSDFPYSKLETRIARRDFRDIAKDLLPTPSMADRSKATGRPHVKIHKSVDVGRREMEGDREGNAGERVEIYCTNLDMSTNCYDRYYIAKVDRTVGLWPIVGRSGAARR